MEKLFNNIMDNAVTTIGSRKWGGFTDRSDYDVVYESKKAEILLNYLVEKNISFESDRGSSASGEHSMFNTHNIKIETSLGVINVLGYQEKDLEKIDRLNAAFSLFSGTSIGDNIARKKEYRIMMCQTLLKNLFEAFDDYEIAEFDEDEMPF